MRVILDISVEPIGTSSTSLSPYVRAVYDFLERKGYNFYPAPSMTTVELEDLNSITPLLNGILKTLEEMGVKRTVIHMKLDYRIDKENSISHKLQVIKRD